MLFTTVACGSVLMALPESGPQPPCGGEISPAYSDIDKPPAIQFWNRAGLNRDWVPPSCTEWTAHGFATLVAVAGRFRNSSGGEDLRRRVGAISKMKGLLYWSTTHHQWQPLIVDAEATEGPHRRGDFVPDELVEGKNLYYQQTDNLSGKSDFRMHILAATPDRLVFATENITTMRYLLIPLFHPGDVQAIYFIERESRDVWRYYSIVRTGRNSSTLAGGHEASAVNRAVAYYRYIAGIKADTEPPAAR